MFLDQADRSCAGSCTGTCYPPVAHYPRFVKSAALAGQADCHLHHGYVDDVGAVEGGRPDLLISGGIRSAKPPPLTQARFVPRTTQTMLARGRRSASLTRSISTFAAEWPASMYRFRVSSVGATCTLRRQRPPLQKSSRSSLPLLRSFFGLPFRFPALPPSPSATFRAPALTAGARPRQQGKELREHRDDRARRSFAHRGPRPQTWVRGSRWVARLPEKARKGRAA
jgi:hypothetical protein